MSYSRNLTCMSYLTIPVPVPEPRPRPVMPGSSAADRCAAAWPAPGYARSPSRPAPAGSGPAAPRPTAPAPCRPICRADAVTPGPAALARRARIHRAGSVARHRCPRRPLRGAAARHPRNENPGRIAGTSCDATAFQPRCDRKPRQAAGSRAVPRTGRVAGRRPDKGLARAPARQQRRIRLFSC